jgi:hypothetical protein
VNIMRAFIGNYRFQIHHVAHDGILAGDAHAPVNLAGFAGLFIGYILPQTSKLVLADGGGFGLIVDGQ